MFIHTLFWSIRCITSISPRRGTRWAVIDLNLQMINDKNDPVGDPELCHHGFGTPAFPNLYKQHCYHNRCPRCIYLIPGAWWRDGTNCVHGKCACVHARSGRVIYKWWTNVHQTTLHSNGDTNRHGTHKHTHTEKKRNFNCASGGPWMNKPFVNYTPKQTITGTFASLTRPSGSGPFGGFINSHQIFWLIAPSAHHLCFYESDVIELK